MTSHPIARRQLLGLLGLGAAALPFANARRAIAQAMAPRAARRLVVFYTPNGTATGLPGIADAWRPRGTLSGGRFALDDAALRGSDVLAPLAASPASMGVAAQASLASRVLVLGGVDIRDRNGAVMNSHQNASCLLTGNALAGSGDAAFGVGPSVDQFVATQFAQNAATRTRLPSLELGVMPSVPSAQSILSYDATSNKLDPQTMPRRAYERVFGPIVTPGAWARLQAERRSVFDAVGADLASIAPSLASDDRVRLEQHVTAVREVEAQLAALDPSAPHCGAAPPPADLPQRGQPYFIGRVGRCQTDLLVAALACNQTRVATLRWDRAGGDPDANFLGDLSGLGTSNNNPNIGPRPAYQHARSHEQAAGGAARRDFVAMENWFGQQFAYLLRRLEATPEPGGDGTMLDHTLVVWASEMRDGTTHRADSIPIVLAGASGYLRTGAYVQYGGVPHGRLLVTICNAMGIDRDDFGNLSDHPGPLAGITR